MMLKKNRLSILLLLSLLFVFHSFNTFAQEYVLSNETYLVKYRVQSNELKLVNLSNQSDTIVYKIAFNIQYKNTPYVTPVRVRILENINYSVAAWSGNPDFFNAGIIESPVIENVSNVGNSLLFEFSETSRYSFDARLELPADGTAHPILSYDLAVKSAAAYSVGFVGSPEFDAAELDELWQPMVWTEKKFPESSYLTLSFHCSLPAVMATKGGITYGVITDPENYPFNPLPDYARSEFGVAIRNQQTKAQPMIWAPVIGTLQSRLAIGAVKSFKIRLFAGPKSIPDYYKELSDELYGFKNYDRNNQLGSLNNTIGNMIAYGMSDFSRFDSVFKAPSYQTDVPGGVKNTSSLSPLNIAMLADDKNIFDKRALPGIEFMLSRSNRTFSSNDAPGSSSSLGNPIMPVSEMVSIYNIADGKMPFLLDLAKGKALNLSNKAMVRQWRDYTALYRATGEETYKLQAMSGADQYIIDRIDNLETGFNYQHHSTSSFWIEQAPKFVDLMELYEISGESRYLDAAYKAARRYAMFTFMSPAVPDVNITVNIGGQAPVYRSGVGPISIPEEVVPAWRMSEYGLHPEAAGTFTTHRAVFMAHHAPYFLRIGVLKNDAYLQRIAKSAIIGRYTNFPGYHINKDRTTVYEKEDFPLRSHEELTSTSMHYNHIWPMISLMYDYLITDVQVKSAGNISFPYEFMEGEANIQNRLFGAKPGKFYDVDSALLWMPKNLLEVDDPQANYISARKADTLLLAFSNQSTLAINPSVSIDTGLLKDLENKQFEYVQDNGSTVISSLSGNTLTIPLSAKGITYVKISNVNPEIAMQENMIKQDSTWENDYTSTSFASVKAMHINFGKDLSSIYVYSSSPVGSYTQMEMKYTLNGVDTLVLSDVLYPFEFTIPLSEDDKTFKFQLISTNSTGVADTSEWMALSEKIQAKASISGNSFIRSGESSKIRLDFEGSAPWSVKYTNGNQDYLLENILETPYIINVSPLQSTSYTLVEAADSNAPAELSGIASVHVLPNYLNPIFDGTVRRQDDRGIFTGNNMELKINNAFAREIFLSIDPAAIPQNTTGKSAIRIYVHQTDKSPVAKLRLEAIHQNFDSSLKWSTRPSDSEFVVAAQDAMFEQWQFPGYISWDISSYLEDFKLSGSTQLTFRVKIIEGNDVLMTAYSSKNNLLKPELLFTDASILSLKDISFNVEENAAGVKIDWKALLENSSGFFEIEHAIDGKKFNVIGNVKIDDQTNGSYNYSFLDVHATKGYNYYRIKYHEEEAKKPVTTEIKVINLKIDQEFSFKLFPNPSSGLVNLSINNPAASEYKIMINDVLGRNFYSKKFTNMGPSNLIQLNVSHLRLRPGIYFVNYNDGLNHKTLKLKTE